MTATLRGVVLAGGSGRRLLPLTRVTNKHLLPVGSEPMLFRPVRKLVEAGIRDVLVVTGVEHMGHIVGALGSGRDFGCEITYRVQDEAGGIAQALGLAEGFASGGPVLVLLGDNVFEAGLADLARAFADRAAGARILLKEVEQPQRFGVPVLEGGRIVDIEEKPEKPGSPYAVTGIYFFDALVYDVIRGLRPSARGELEITDVLCAYLRAGTLDWGLLPGWWTDAGTHASLRIANELVAAERREG